MFSDTIKRIERQYEIKRSKADALFVEEKKAIYDKTPRLSEIDKRITACGIQTAKLSIQEQTAENKQLINNLQQEIRNLKKEKVQILDAMKVKLLPKYSCTKCNDTGYVIKNGVSEMCSCMKQELLNEAYNKSNMNNLKNETFENLNLNLFSNIKNENKFKSELSPRENIEKIVKVSKEFINNFEQPTQKNLLFTGTTGIGKTYISSCIANEILKKGHTVLYQTAPVLLETIIDNKFNKYRNSSMNDFNNQVLNVDLLIIDDLGTECINSMKISELFTIINARSLNLNNRVTKTIISTNLSIEKIFGVYEERIGSRIAGFYDIYYFFGEDLRLMK